MSTETAVSVIRLFILALSETQRLKVDAELLREVFAKVRAENRDVSAEELDAMEADALSALDDLDRAIAERRVADGGAA